MERNTEGMVCSMPGDRMRIGVNVDVNLAPHERRAHVQLRWGGPLYVENRSIGRESSKCIRGIERVASNSKGSFMVNPASPVHVY